jgi:hypothetical protein
LLEPCARERHQLRIAPMLLGHREQRALELGDGGW